MMSIDDIINGSTVSFTEEERQSLLDLILNQLADDEDESPKKKTPAELRKKYPVLKDAYDQYRMVLKLVQQEETEE